MGSIWTYNYAGNTILVKNSFKTELYVNGELQDALGGLNLKAELNGKLASGEIIKASIGGTFDVVCTLSIDDVVQEPCEIS